MKAGELAKLLAEHPDAEVEISVDLPYTLLDKNGCLCEKIFGSGIIDVQVPSDTGFGSDEFMIQFESGELS